MLETWAKEVDVKELLAWKEILTPVLEKLAAAAAGELDTEWWQKICTRVSMGSGPRYLSGWLNAFMFFRKGRRAVKMKYPWDKGVEEVSPYGYINTDSVPQGVVEVPIQVDDNGDVFDATLYAGTFGALYDSESNQVRPQNDFLVVRNK